MHFTDSPYRIVKQLSVAALSMVLGCATDDSNAAPGTASGSTSGTAGTSGGQATETSSDDAGSTGDAGSSDDTETSGGEVDACDARVPAFSSGEQLVTHPFVGVCVVHRTTAVPRPLSYAVVIINPDAPGIGFVVTPENGREPRDTTLQTTRAFVEEQGAALAINGNFFAPWPSIDAYADVRGLAASDGHAYSPFVEGYPFGLNVAVDHVVSIVHWDETGAMGFESKQGVELHNAVGAREQILTRGVNTANWPELHPRTAAGVTDDGELVLIVVDGRQDGISEGVTTTELGDILLQEFDVVDAINLDGGGSSTLVIADPEPRLANVPSGLTSERPVGNNLAVFAAPRQTSNATDELIAYEPFEYPHRPWGGATWPEGGGVVNLLGGVGWASPWRDDRTHARASGIAVYPTNAGTGDDARTLPLGYVDGSGAALRTAGNQMRTSFGTSSSAWRVLDLSRVDPQLLNGNGKLGAPGTTLWLSVLAQSHSGAAEDRWAYLELGGALRIGRFAATDGRWGLEVAGGGAQASTVSAGQAALLLVKLDFSEAAATASLWVNPPLEAAPGDAAAIVMLPALELWRVVIEGRYSTDFDELRLGTTPRAVLPVAR